MTAYGGLQLSVYGTLAKARILNNVFYNGAVQTSSILLNLLLMPYITRILGKDALGINSFGQAIVGYFVLLGNLGITIYGAKVIAECRDDKNRKQQKFAECVTYQFFFNVIAILLYNSWVIFQGDYIYFLFNIIILTSMTDLSWAYTGMERFDLIAVRNLVIKFVGTLLIFLFVKQHEDLSLFIIIQQGVLLISNVVFWLELDKLEIVPRFSSLTLSLKNIFNPAISVFIPSVFTSLYLSLNKVMLGYLSSIDEVAIYDYPNRLVRIGITFIGILGTVMMPRLAYLHHNQSKQEYQNKTKDLFRYSLLISVPAFFLLELVALPLCDIFFSETFEGADMVIKIVAPTLITSGLSLYVIYVSLNKMKTFLNCVAIGALVSLVLNILLMPHYGAIGAAISLLATEIVVHILLLYYLRSIYSLRWLLHYLFKIIAVCTSIYVLLVIVLGDILSLLEMCLAIFYYGILYGLCFLLYLRKM